MATTRPNTDPWPRVFTTLPHPLPSSAERTPTLSPRLLLRPLAATDLDGLFLLTTQHEVMKWTAAGRTHSSHQETMAKLAEFLPPNDTKTFNCAICLRATGELIGIGGVHRFSRVEARHGGAAADQDGWYGWPELGYMLKKEFWGMGLATEFVTAFVGMWEQLRRAAVEVQVHVKSLGVVDAHSGFGGAVRPAAAREELIAIVERENGASERILRKCGFELFDKFTERHKNDPDRLLELSSFRYFPHATSNAT